MDAENREMGRDQFVVTPVACLIDRLTLRSNEHTVRGQSGQAYRYPIPGTLRIFSVPSALGPSFRRRLLT
jgi:hypothetical protein